MSAVPPPPTPPAAASGPLHASDPPPSPEAAGTAVPPFSAPPTGPAEPPASRWPAWVAVTAVVLAGLWAVLVGLLAQTVGWLVAQALIIEAQDVPGWYWPLVTALGALVGAAPAALISLVVRRPAPALVSRVWVTAAVAAVLLGLARWLPWSAGDAAANATTALIAAGLALALGRRRAPTAPTAPAVADAPGAGRDRALGVVGAASLGLMLALPWWWVGALGSPVDTVAAALAAFALGAVVGRLWAGARWLIGIGGVPHRVRPRWRPVLDVLVLAVPLVGLAGAVGAPGAQLPLLVTLPLAGVAVAATDRRRWAPAALVVAGASFGPLGLVDAEEVTLLLTEAELPYWVAVGTGVAALTTLVVGGGGFAVRALLRHRDRTRAGGAADGRTPRRVAVAALAGLTALAAVTGLVWLGPGQPGFHGDRLFVVLDTQADLAGIDGAPAARRRAVYDRLVTHARREQGPLLRALRRVGAAPTPYYLVNAVEVADTPVVRALLAGRDDVVAVRPSPRLRPLPAAAEPTRGTVPLPAAPRNLAAVRAPVAWAGGVDGQGLVVGLSDSGVDGRHPALRDNYRGGADSWYDPWNHTSAPTDPQGHGTHTAGTAVGRGVGVAPGATWIGCTNLGRNLANPAYYLDCLQFMLAPFPRGGDPLADGDPTRGADILNNSWACPETEGCAADTLLPAVRALRTAGVFVVASAGNSGPECGTVRDPLARYDEVLSVGAVDSRSRVVSFSSRGPVRGGDSVRPKPDLVAPGLRIVSALPGGGYGPLSGTSMAGPHVAGVVALLWQAEPALRGDIDRTTELLRRSARPPAATRATTRCGGPENVVGAGVVDAAAAIALARR